MNDSGRGSGWCQVPSHFFDFSKSKASWGTITSQLRVLWKGLKGFEKVCSLAVVPSPDAY